MKGLGDLDEALQEHLAALAIMDSVGAPTAAGRMQSLQFIAEIYGLKGPYEEAEKAAALALDGLDANVTDQAAWIKKFQDQLARCREGGAP